MRDLLLAAGLCAVCSVSSARDSVDLVCAYAPSKSSATLAGGAAAAGAGAGVASVLSSLGLSVVTHSSGALILSGGSGYVAGTLGVAAAAPAVVTVAAVVAGTAVTFELACAPRNHPQHFARVTQAAKALSVDARQKIDSVQTQAAPVIEKATVAVKKGVSDVYRYAFPRMAQPKLGNCADAKSAHSSSPRSAATQSATINGAAIAAPCQY